MNKKNFILSASVFLGSCKGNYFDYRDKGAEQSTPAAAAAAASGETDSSESGIKNLFSKEDYAKVVHSVSDEEVYSGLVSASEKSKMPIDEYKKFMNDKFGKRNGYKVSSKEDLIYSFKREYYTVQDHEEVTDKTTPLVLNSIKGIDSRVIQKICMADDLMAFVFFVCSGNDQFVANNILLCFRDGEVSQGSINTLDAAFQFKSFSIIKFLCSTDSNNLINRILNGKVVRKYLGSSRRIKSYFESSQIKKLTSEASELRIRIKNPIALLCDLYGISKAETLEKVIQEDGTISMEEADKLLMKRNMGIYKSILQIPDLTALNTLIFTIRQGRVEEVEEVDEVKDIAPSMTPNRAKALSSSNHFTEELTEEMKKSLTNINNEISSKNIELTKMMGTLSIALGDETFVNNLYTLILSGINKDNSKYVFSYFLKDTVLGNEQEREKKINMLKYWFYCKERRGTNKEGKTFNQAFREENKDTILRLFGVSKLDDVEKSFKSNFGMDSEKFFAYMYLPLIKNRGRVSDFSEIISRKIQSSPVEEQKLVGMFSSREHDLEISLNDRIIAYIQKAISMKGRIKALNERKSDLTKSLNEMARRDERRK